MIRIVKMTFKPECIEEFKETFEQSKPTILTFDGCSDVRLLQDKHDGCVMMTYSIWDTEDSLNTYRSSEFFRKTWKHTKTLFLKKPEANSFSRLDK